MWIQPLETATVQQCVVDPFYCRIKLIIDSTPARVGAIT